jgi:hypothetical protein
MNMTQKYDIAAYVWPSYHKDPRSSMFWPQGFGEWESVMSSLPKFPGHTQPRQPIWGYVNEADRYVMQMQIDAAADHGINVFIYDWYWYDRRPFLEGCLNEGYLKAANNHRVKFYLMWANHDAKLLWDKRLAGRTDAVVWLGGVDRIEFERLAKRVLRQYFFHPSYYTINGQPVFSIYELKTLIDGFGGMEQTRDALAWFKDIVKDAGLPGLHLQCVLIGAGMNANPDANDNLGLSPQDVQGMGFDSVTHYQYCHFTNIDRSYLGLMPDVIQTWQRVNHAYSIPYYPHVSVGWDANPRFTTFRPGIITENEPKHIEQALRQAKDYVDHVGIDPPLITLNSWNEWTETSYLQPDTLYGYGYLDAIKKVFLDES